MIILPNDIVILRLYPGFEDPYWRLNIVYVHMHYLYVSSVVGCWFLQSGGNDVGLCSEVCLEIFAHPRTMVICWFYEIK